MVLSRKKSFIFPFVLSLALFSCYRPQVFPVGKGVTCGAEKRTVDGKEFYAENDSTFRFGGGKLQTTREAHSGKYAVMTTRKKAFAFTFHIPRVNGDAYYKISVWRKGKNSQKGVLVATSKRIKDLYITTAEPVKKDKNGWEKLEMDLFTPPTFSGKELMIYVWNNSNDTIYFDDLRISHPARKTYPSYTEEPLDIVLDTSQYMKIARLRKEAFENGILQTTQNDWAKAIVFGDSKMMKAKIRLKGDWLDHLQGDKWSFRIKLKKHYAWHHLRTFSVQTPEARDYLMEWASHRFYESEDILTTRYGFVPLTLNNRPLGLYAWEEHFVKQLVESRKRREGPIVKFSEDAFWQIQKMAIAKGNWPRFPYFQTAVIEPFMQSKTLRTPALRQEFLNASRLLQQYKYSQRPPSEIFDLDALAKYYAMLELTHARHGMAWHNQRFYYNPIICMLEPIAYDGYTNHLHSDFSIHDNYLYHAYDDKTEDTPEQLMMYRLFHEKAFREKYWQYLKKFSRAGFVDSVSHAMQKRALFYDSLIREEFPQAEYDTNFFRKSAAQIRQYLPALKVFVEKKIKDTAFRLKQQRVVYDDTTVFEDTPEYFVNAYIQRKLNDSVLLHIENYFPRNIILLGTGKKARFADFHFIRMPGIKAYSGSHADSARIWADTLSRYLFFMIKGHSETYVTAIHPWPVPRGLTPRQELMKKVNLKLPVFAKVKGKDIYVKPGKTLVDYPVVIPKGYVVHFGKGTTLDLVQHALFLSFSPVIMEGTPDKPVIITSSDSTAEGFTLLQVKGNSVIRNVQFTNLNTLDYKTWQLTGAVTFYESNVHLENVLLKNNQCEDGINMIRSQFTLEDARFENTYSDAFDADFSNGLVRNCTFYNVGNDALDLSGSRIRIDSVYANYVNDKGISGGEDSHLVVSRVVVNHANIGMASKDLSDVKVSDSRISNCRYGLVLLQKKAEYGPATMEIRNIRILKTNPKWLVEKGSAIVLDGKIIVGKEKNLDKLFY